jgi:L-rhamnonate dehydratase
MNKRQFLRRAGRVAVFASLGGGRSALLTSLDAQTANSSGAARDNRIARVTATTVNVPCEYVAGSYKRQIRMGGVVAEVETADGLTGHGFTSIINQEIVVAAIRDVVTPYLIGKDAMAREMISEDLYWRMTPRGQSGHAVQALAAIDCALWDIAGKRYNEPIWRLLGGARNEVRVYTTCGQNFLSRDELAQSAREMVKSGLPRLKMVVASGADNIDRGNKSIEAILSEDAARVRVMREAAGPEASVSIDANQSLDEYQARHLARQIADYNIGFF